MKGLGLYDIIRMLEKLLNTKITGVKINKTQSQYMFVPKSIMKENGLMVVPQFIFDLSEPDTLLIRWGSVKNDKIYYGETPVNIEHIINLSNSQCKNKYYDTNITNANVPCGIVHAIISKPFYKYSILHAPMISGCRSYDNKYDKATVLYSNISKNKDYTTYEFEIAITIGESNIVYLVESIVYLNTDNIFDIHPFEIIYYVEHIKTIISLFICDEKVIETELPEEFLILNY